MVLGDEFVGEVDDGFTEGGFDLYEHEAVGGEDTREVSQQGMDGVHAFGAAVKGQGWLVFGYGQAGEFV